MAKKNYWANVPIRGYQSYLIKGCTSKTHAKRKLQSFICRDPLTPEKDSYDIESKGIEIISKSITQAAIFED